MFNTVFNFIEGLGMLVEDKTYKATHPCTWTGTGSGSGKENEVEEKKETNKGYSLRSAFSNENETGEERSKRLRRSILTTFSGCDVDFDAVDEEEKTLEEGIKELISNTEYLETLKNLLSEKEYDSTIKAIEKLNDPKLPEDDKRDIINDLSNIQISFTISDLFKMDQNAESNTDDQDKDDSNNTPGSGGGSGTTSKKTTTQTKTKTEPKGKTPVKTPAASKVKEKLNLKEAIEQTPLGGKLFEHVDPIPASN